MARFYGTVQGGRGEASRLGDAKSGIITTTRGWDLGATCRMDAVTRDGEDTDQLGVTIDNGSGRGNKDFGSFTVIRQGDSVAIIPDARFIERCDITLAISHLRVADVERREIWSKLILQDEEWVKLLRTKLWIGGHIPPVDIVPRRPLDDDQPDGYLESDKDFVLNNIEACVAYLESRGG